MNNRSKWVVALLLALAMVFSSSFAFAESDARYLAPNQVMTQAGYKHDASGNLVDSKALFRIKPAKSGYIEVYIAELGYDTSFASVTLLNSKRKVVSEKLWYSSGSDTSYIRFGVKKGTTYYLKVEGAQGSSYNNYNYNIKYVVKSAPVRKNAKKGKAVTLKRKAKAKATAMPAELKKKTHWYKFKVSKKRATKVRVDATNLKSGKVTATVYYGGKKVGSSIVSNGYVNNYSLTYGTTYGKANKGTYYLKLVGDSKANGQYKVRYNK